MRKIKNIKGIKKLTQYNVCGIYFLMECEKCVYIGQSTDIASRISAHIGDEKKIFDSVFYIEFKKEELDLMESVYIATYCPKYNIQKRIDSEKLLKVRNGDIMDMTLSEICKIYSISDVMKTMKAGGLL